MAKPTRGMSRGLAGVTKGNSDGSEFRPLHRPAQRPQHISEILPPIIRRLSRARAVRSYYERFARALALACSHQRLAA